MINKINIFHKIHKSTKKKIVMFFIKRKYKKMSKKEIIY